MRKEKIPFAELDIFSGHFWQTLGLENTNMKQ
jgi:hypothetical protein